VLAGELAALKRRFGGNSYRLVAAGPMERLREVPGIREAIVQDGAARLLLDDGADGPSVLRHLVGFLSIAEFRSEEPDLEEIFLQALRDEG
jgi:ABC-type uncharacterized transport system ATPase subunit